MSLAAVQQLLPGCLLPPAAAGSALAAAQVLSGRLQSLLRGPPQLQHPLHHHRHAAASPSRHLATATSTTARPSPALLRAFSSPLGALRYHGNHGHGHGHAHAGGAAAGTSSPGAGQAHLDKFKDILSDAPEKFQGEAKKRLRVGMGTGARD